MSESHLAHPLTEEVHYSHIKGHKEFIKSLAEMYGTKHLTPRDLKWVDIKKEHFAFPPNIEIFVSPDVPAYKTAIVGVNNGKVISSPHCSALMCKENSYLGRRNDILQHRIIASSDKLWADFPAPSSLEELISGLEMIGHNFPDNTPVIEAVSLMPTSIPDTFSAEFYPSIQMMFSGHYAFILICQHRILDYFYVSGFGNYKTDLFDVDKNDKCVRFSLNAPNGVSELAKTNPTITDSVLILALPIKGNSFIGQERLKLHYLQTRVEPETERTTVIYRIKYSSLSREFSML